ncbi:MAG: ABC transporter permease [Gemmatimonadaceae bacterium]
MNRVAARVARAQWQDVLRSRWIVAYTGFFLLLSEGLLRFAGGDAKAVLSLGSASLMIIPLATLTLSTLHVYNTREFTELLLAQPIKRRDLFAGLYVGMTLPAAGAFLLGAGLPFLVRGGPEPAQRGAFAVLLFVGIALTFAFGAIAVCIALGCEDRLRGMGRALGVWLLLAIVYDGVVLTAVALFSDYPIERPLLALMFANPVDLGRVLLLLHLDAAALMGYTGAVFERFIGGAGGSLLAAGMLCLWVAAPVAIGARQFRRKDF